MKRGTLWAGCLFGLSLVLYPPSLVTIQDLILNAVAQLHATAPLRERLNNPRAGEARLIQSAPFAPELDELLARHGAERFALSPAIMKDREWRYQTLRLLWPRRFDPAAYEKAFLNSESIPENCKPIERGKEIQLARCP